MKLQSNRFNYGDADKILLLLLLFQIVRPSGIRVLPEIASVSPLY